MLLAIDQGNSDTVFGLHRNDSWQDIWRTPTTGKNSSGYEAQMRQWLLDSDLKPSDIEGVVISSVVPEYKAALTEFVRGFIDRKPLTLNAEVYAKIKLKLNSPHEIGSDLVANSVAASDRFPEEVCLVVDFGTALTVTCTKNNEILGVSIAPGLQTAVKSLFKHTAQLPEVPLKLPESVLGKNTIHAIQAGILHGYIGLVRNLVQQAQKELDQNCKVIATGGAKQCSGTSPKRFRPDRSTFNAQRPQGNL